MPLDVPVPIATGERRGTAVLLPVKSFHDAKERLKDILTSEERYDLAQRLAQGVLDAIHPQAVAVVCDNREVADWAEASGAMVIWAPGRGLNVAVASGVAALKSAGHGDVTIVHADLPFPEDLRQLPASGSLIVPDRHRDGTNVLRIPTDSSFTFSYGPGSFERHVGEAVRCGLELHVVESELLGIDIDVESDLKLPEVQTRLWGPKGPHASHLK